MENKEKPTMKQMVEKLLTDQNKELTTDEMSLVLYTELNNRIIQRLGYEFLYRMSCDQTDKASGKDEISRMAGQASNAKTGIEVMDRDIAIYRQIIKEIKEGKLVI